VVLRLGEDLGNERPVVHSQVRYDDPRMIPFGPQRQQKGMGTVLVTVGVDGNMQQVIGVGIHRKDGRWQMAYYQLSAISS